MTRDADEFCSFTVIDSVSDRALPYRIRDTFELRSTCTPARPPRTAFMWSLHIMHCRDRCRHIDAHTEITLDLTLMHTMCT